MARTARIVPAVAPVQTANGASAPPLDDGQDPIPQTQLDRITLALGATPDPRSKVKLLRDAAWCADFKPSEWEAGGFEVVRRRFGPGTYTVLVYGKADGRQFGIVMREDVEIAADLAAGGIALEAPRGAEAPGSSTDALLRQVLERLSAAPAVPPVDTTAAVIAQLKMFRELRELVAPPAAPGSGLAEQIQLLRAIREAGNEFAGKDTDNAWRDILEVIKPLVPVIMKMAVPGLAAPAAATDTEPEAVAIDPAKLEASLQQLLDWAAAKAPHDPAVKLVLEALPDGLIDALHRDDWWPLLIESLPQFEPHSEWMHTLREAVVKADATEAA
jgi:hypothetical protein